MHPPIKLIKILNKKKSHNHCRNHEKELDDCTKKWTINYVKLVLKNRSIMLIKPVKPRVSEGIQEYSQRGTRDNFGYHFLQIQLWVLFLAIAICGFHLWYVNTDKCFL